MRGEWLSLYEDFESMSDDYRVIIDNRLYYENDNDQIITIGDRVIYEDSCSFPTYKKGYVFGISFGTYWHKPGEDINIKDCLKRESVEILILTECDCVIESNINNICKICAGDDTPYTVYGHFVPSGKWYFGLTKQVPEKRWSNGKGYAGTFFGKAIEKYGWDNIYHNIILDGLSEQEACYLEKRLIARYDTMNPENGYNRTPGGNKGSLGHRMSEDSKQRIREANRNRQIYKYNCRKVVCVETGEEFGSISEAANSVHVYPHVISKFCRGEYVNEHLMVSSAGGFHWKFAEESKKLRTRSGRRVICIETGAEYDSIIAAGRAVGLSRQSITTALKDGKPVRGLHWKYLDEQSAA